MAQVIDRVALFNNNLYIMEDDDKRWISSDRGDLTEPTDGEVKFVFLHRSSAHKVSIDGKESPMIELLVTVFERQKVAEMNQVGV